MFHGMTGSEQRTHVVHSGSVKQGYTGTGQYMVRRFVFRTATGWWIVPIGLICRRSPLLGLAEGKGTGTIEEGTRNFHAAT